MMYLFGLIDVNNIHLIGALKRTVHTDIVTVHVSTNSITLTESTDINSISKLNLYVLFILVNGDK